jgi:hypothetical protein
MSGFCGNLREFTFQNNGFFVSDLNLEGEIQAAVRETLKASRKY